MNINTGEKTAILISGEIMKAGFNLLMGTGFSGCSGEEINYYYLLVERILEKDLVLGKFYSRQDFCRFAFLGFSSKNEIQSNDK